MSGNKLISAFAILMLAGCTTLPRVGQPIQISPYLEQVEGTKVSYSGDKSGDLERIDWEVGDIIRVYQEYNGEVTEAKYRIKSFEPDGYRSKAEVDPVGDPLTYKGEGTYIYRGYYPGNEDGHLAGDVYSFSVSSSQSNDVRNNLFMVVSNYTTEAQKVKLEFSPVVNAYQFELPNSVSKIQLESLTDNISGAFTLQNGERTFNGSGRTIEVPTTGGVVRVFTMPQEKMSGDLLLRIYHSAGVKAYGLENSQYPFFGVYHKYNFPAISSPITSSKVVNGVVSAEAHKRGLNWQFGVEWKGEDPNKLYGEFPVPGGNAWMEVPAEKLWEIIESVVDLKLTNTWEAKEITAEDLNVFPNLRTVDIDASNLESIEVRNPNITSLKISSQSLKHVSVENCDGLTTFTVYSQMNLRSVTVRNNANLKDFTVEGSNNFSDATFTIICDSCPELTTFTWKGGDGWGIRYHKEINNCPKFGTPKTPSGSTEI